MRYFNMQQIITGDEKEIKLDRFRLHLILFMLSMRYISNNREYVQVSLSVAWYQQYVVYCYILFYARIC